MQVDGISGISKLLGLFDRAKLGLDAEEIADILWLAVQMGEVRTASVPEAKQPEITPTIDRPSPSIPNITSTAPSLPREPQAAVYASPPQKSSEDTDSLSMLPFRAPAAAALANKLELGRSLRPLMRKIPSHTNKILDEEATADRIARENIWIPVLQAAPERWLELAIVIEKTASFPIWEDTIAEFQQLMERHGAFRNVSFWYLQTNATGGLELFAGRRTTGDKRPRSWKELLDPAQRRLILIVSDCVSSVWRSGQMKAVLDLWAKHGPVTLLQLLPQRLWSRSVLGAGVFVPLSAHTAGVANSRLVTGEIPGWLEIDAQTKLALPIVTLEPEPLKQWARVIAGGGQVQTAGVVLDDRLLAIQAQVTEEALQTSLTAEARVKRFWATASLTARQLAGLMAASPVSLPVVYLIQRQLLPESSSVHLAEVFMGGLLRSVESNNSTSQTYDFIDGVRERLIDANPISDTEAVLERLSAFVAQKTGIAIDDFTAFLAPDSSWDASIRQEITPFARVTRQVLQRLGGEYAALVEQFTHQEEVISAPLSQISSADVALFANFPPLQTFEFEVATITIEEDDIVDDNIVEDNTVDNKLQPFEFEVATIELRESEFIIHRQRHQARRYIEQLADGVELEMVAIPQGTFLMGSPEAEAGHNESESPQHLVTIKPFFMGKFPVTQAQWKAVATLPKINRELKPDPSYFKGANLPVEQVSWSDAVEFCVRLCKKNGRNYRLPSEAEWEYACRAGKTTPFHFSETIITDLANYNISIYGIDSKEVHFERTTPVGSFSVANAFGLYDMHGNVWEWCADCWHDNYQGAPSNGSIWLSNDENSGRLQLLRGGSWVNGPGFCRSAFRVWGDAGFSNYDIGFRVVCAAEWTQ